MHAILDDIKTRNNTEGFAYFYCKRDEKDRHDADSIFRAILKQLCARPGTKALQAPVVREYELRKQDGFASGTLRLQESKRLIVELLNIYPQSTIVIDGLDECDQAAREWILPALLELVGEPDNLVKLCVSSRDERDIGLSFRHHPNHLIQPSDTTEDIDRYLKLVLREKISQRKLLDGRVDPALEERIYSTLRERAHGMYASAVLSVLFTHSTAPIFTGLQVPLGQSADPHALQHQHAVRHRGTARPAAQHARQDLSGHLRQQDRRRGRQLEAPGPPGHDVDHDLGPAAHSDRAGVGGGGGPPARHQPGDRRRRY